MTLELQAHEFLALAKRIAERIDEKDGELMGNTFGVNSQLGIQVEGKLFVELAKLTKGMTGVELTTEYQSAHLHARLRVHYTDFHYCTSLLK